METKPVPSSYRVMRTPRSLDLEITSRCNLRCRYCYFFDNPAVEYKDIPTSEWLRFIDELGECGVMDVCLAGGEPFMREDLPELIDAIVRNRMRFSILSNGTLITDNIASCIAATKRCDYVQVSIDASCAQVHETGRGNGSFAKAVQGIKTLQEHGIAVTSRITIHHDNVHDLENTARFLLEELMIPQISTNAAGYFGTCRKNSNGLLLSVKDRELAMSTLLELEQKYNGRITAAAGPLAEARNWKKMAKALADNEPAFADGGRLTGCGCTWDKMAVRSDGVLIPCIMLAHMELGYINRDSLAEVWQHDVSLNNLRRRSSISLAEFDYCAGCDYQEYCTGNCPGLAHTLTGEVNHPSPDACLRKFFNEGGRVPGFGK